MQLEKIAISLRRRNPWEALDLGRTMLRAWAGPAYRAWLYTYGVAGLLVLLLSWSNPTIAVAAIWWLKPAFDRVLLFVYSRALFHTPTTWRDVRAALPDLILRSGLLHGLTVGRFSLARSFLLPVRQLEGQSGKAARERCKVLSRRVRGNAVWLTFVCANIASVTAFSLLFLVSALTPTAATETFSPWEWFASNNTPQEALLAVLMTLVAESMIEPFYVASGFALYLHRRSELEGWDIELSFRRLAARAGTAAMAATAAVAMLALTAGLALTPVPLQAAEQAPPSAAKTKIDAVLADPVFGQKTQEMEWHWRGQTESEVPDEVPDGKPWWLGLRNLLESVSLILKGLVWVAAILLAVWLLYLVLRYHERWWGSGKRAPAPPDFLFGLDLRPESLPEDIVGAARAALAAGRFEAALSLLYRGALVALIRRAPVEFKIGDTEADCRRRIAGHLEGEAGDYFGRLIDSWGSTAYAHHQPAPAAIEALCQDWDRHFGAPRGAAAA